MSSAVSSYSLAELVTGRRFALLVNRSALTASCAANFVSAYTKQAEAGWIDDPYTRGGVAMLWPLSLVGAEWVLTRVPAVGSTAVLWSSRIGALVIAVCAFTGSAEHLISLAERTGASTVAAYSAPIIIDGLLIISGIVLVALASTIAAKKQQLTAEESTPVVESPVVAEPVTAVERSQPARVDRPALSQPVSSSKRSSVTSDEVAAALKDAPASTAKALGDQFGVSAKTISRTDAWKNRKSLDEVAA